MIHIIQFILFIGLIKYTIMHNQFLPINIAVIKNMIIFTVTWKNILIYFFYINHHIIYVIIRVANTFLHLMAAETRSGPRLQWVMKRGEEEQMWGRSASISASRANTRTQSGHTKEESIILLIHSIS